MDIVSFLTTYYILQMVLALVLGSILGAQREYMGKAAGLRTYALVTFGSALFTHLSQVGFTGGEGVQFDPSRVASQVVVGIGFLGAGLIIFRGVHVEGLTTAAGLWAAAAVGMAVGVGFYGMAISATILVFFTLSVLGWLDIGKMLKRGRD